MVGHRLGIEPDRADERDRGEVTATTAIIVLLVIAAIAAGTIIATRDHHQREQRSDALTAADHVGERCGIGAR